MFTKDFDYTLPSELIAQVPLTKRDSSRLMVLSKTQKCINHKKFDEIFDILDSNDILVFNNTKVIKARLFVRRKTGARIELFLLHQEQSDIWRCLMRPAKKVKTDEELIIAPKFKCKVLEKHLDSTNEHRIQFYPETTLLEALEKYGLTPLPPYIKNKNDEIANKFQNNYQTVIAKEPGAIAAPTAGLHFSKSLLDKARKKNIGIEYITLHVGYGTFKPVKAKKITDHKIHSEWYDINKETAERLNKAYQKKKRIIAVGTTVARTLESNFKNDKIKAGSGYTNIFIYPGYKFKAINGLLTNFHLPRSTLLMMVAAFTDYKFILKAYREAIDRKYRFFSFGDAMLILP